MAATPRGLCVGFGVLTALVPTARAQSAPPSAAFDPVSGTLTIAGTSGDDVIGVNGDDYLISNAFGSDSACNLGLVRALEVFTGAGDDVVLVNFAEYDIEVQTGAGADCVLLFPLGNDAGLQSVSVNTAAGDDFVFVFDSCRGTDTQYDIFTAAGEDRVVMALGKGADVWNVGTGPRDDSLLVADSLEPENLGLEALIPCAIPPLPFCFDPVQEQLCPTVPAPLGTSVLNLGGGPSPQTDTLEILDTVGGHQVLGSVGGFATTIGVFL